VLVITDRTAEMAAHVTERLDLSLIFVQENAVVIDPAGELAVLFSSSTEAKYRKGPRPPSGTTMSFATADMNEMENDKSVAHQRCERGLK
jgi:hypothetical protein